MHSGYIWPKPTKNKMWFHEFFPSKFQQIHIISVFRVPIDPILPKIRSFDVISRVVLFGSNLPKIRSFDRISRVLTSKFQQIYIISVSGVLFGPNSPKKKDSLMWFHDFFTSKFQLIHIISVSGHCMRFLSKICQTVAGTTMIGQFPEFLGGSNFWRGFDTWPSVRRPDATAACPAFRPLHTFMPIDNDVRC